MSQNIKGKLYTKKDQEVSNKQFKAQANVSMSAEDVISGVPRGTVTPILIIMISEEKKVKKRVVTCTADNTSQ